MKTQTKNNLTQKQNLVLENLREMIEQGEGNPTTYALAKYLRKKGIDDASVKSISQVVEALENKDMLKRDVFRKIYVVENDGLRSCLNEIFSVPVYGLASCGEALAFAEDNIEGYLQISESIMRPARGARLFAVKALGDSMDKDRVNDGDYVIFEKKDNDFDYNGKIVVAVVNGLATIKRYKKMGDGLIALLPNSTNSFHQPIYIHEDDSVMIAGVFRKVLPVKYISL